MVQMMQGHCVAVDVLGEGAVWMLLMMVALVMPLLRAV